MSAALSAISAARLHRRHLWRGDVRKSHIICLSLCGAAYKGVHTLVVASRGEVGILVMAFHEVVDTLVVASHMEGGALVVGIHKWVVSQLGDAHRRSVASNW